MLLSSVTVISSITSLQVVNRAALFLTKIFVSFLAILYVTKNICTCSCFGQTLPLFDQLVVKVLNWINYRQWHLCHRNQSTAFGIVNRLSEELFPVSRLFRLGGLLFRLTEVLLSAKYKNVSECWSFGRFKTLSCRHFVTQIANCPFSFSLKCFVFVVLLPE